MKILAIIFVCISIGVCSYAETKRQSVSPSVKAELLAVFSVNEELHQAFFEYEEKKGTIPSLAAKLSESIKGISDLEIRKLLRFSQSKLAEMNVKSIKVENDQRYHLVSMTLIHILNKYDIGSDYNAYSCPMVKKKWIQNTAKVAKIHNPYAEKMPHCGSKDSKH